LVLEQEIGPELEALAALGGQPVHAAQMVEIDRAAPPPSADLGRSPAPEVQRFVQSAVDLVRLEQGQELVEEVGDQGEAAWIGGAEPEGFGPWAEGMIDALGH